jgi:hypothetical protein
MFGDAVCDPACGTGGFLFTAHQYLTQHYPNLTRDEKRHLKQGAFRGGELVQATARVRAMVKPPQAAWTAEGRPRGRALQGAVNPTLYGIGSEKSVTLQNLLKIGRLKAHEPNAAEVQRLLAAIRRNLTDAVATNISAETRFDAAYKAVMQCALRGGGKWRRAEERWRAYTCEELIARGKGSLDIFWLSVAQDQGRWAGSERKRRTPTLALPLSPLRGGGMETSSGSRTTASPTATTCRRLRSSRRRSSRT